MHEDLRSKYRGRPVTSKGRGRRRGAIPVVVVCVNCLLLITLQHCKAYRAAVARPPLLRLGVESINILRGGGDVSKVVRSSLAADCTVERVVGGEEEEETEERRPSNDDSNSNSNDCQEERSSNDGETESEEDGDTCCLCCEKTKHWAVGRCGHRVACAVCSLRMRGILNSTSCVTCKQEQPFLVVSAE